MTKVQALKFLNRDLQNIPQILRIPSTNGNIARRLDAIGCTFFGHSLTLTPRRTQNNRAESLHIFVRNFPLVVTLARATY